MFNTSLIYELGILKPYATQILEEVPENEPEYASVINVVTATLCTITMPFIVWLYQL